MPCICRVLQMVRELSLYKRGMRVGPGPDLPDFPDVADGWIARSRGLSNSIYVCLPHGGRHKENREKTGRAMCESDRDARRRRASGESYQRGTRACRRADE